MPYTSRRPRSGQTSSAPRAAHFGGGSRRSGGGGGRPFGGGRSNSRGPKKDYIHPSRFVKAAKPVSEEKYEPVNMFADFAMNPIIMRNIKDKGYVAPSPVQDQAIPHGLAGRDVIGVANTGTGKTVAFAVPVIHKLMEDPNAKALIIAPTRELAQQIEEERRALARGGGLYGALLIGGSNMGFQLRDLQRGVRMVVGTPGRIMDHMQRGSLNLNEYNVVVLDEVDRMLDMGFVNDVRTILGELHEDRQSFFFSATLDNRVRDLIHTFANDPALVSVKTGDTSDNVHQDIVPYETQSDKIEQLHRLLEGGQISKAIVFDDTQRSVERLSQELVARGFKADAIHGGKTQGQRKRALDRFKRDDITVLVATDVAARGIDVKDISHVINYSTPQSYEDYVHRIGRAGRAGATGYALTFVTDDRRDSRY
ncbi:MAG TPA: DEAD/DEAH box helicase [Candidatus Saccharimonadales bacterium]|nr:DEAD/DEAH box helicase [Candidatus Saccharimonadales bacterium]